MMGSVSKIAVKWEKSFVKTIAVITTTSFILTGVCGQAIAAISADAQQKLPAASAAVDNSLIPTAAGKITDARFMGSEDVVINIQNLHCHPEVQRNINTILVNLNSKHALSRLCLEGASGDLDTSLFNSIKNEELRNKIVESLVKKGELTGAEYFAINSGANVKLIGIENEQLYRENSIRLGKINENTDEVSGVLREMNERLNKVKESYLNAKQKSIESIVLKHRAGKLATGKYYRMLEKHADSLGIDAGGYRNFTRFQKLLALEKDLNYRRISRDMKDLMTDLRNRLPYSEYSSLAAKANGDKREELYKSMAGAVLKNNINIAEAYPQLDRFFAYLRANQAINPISLLRDEYRLLEEIQLTLAANDREREVVSMLNTFRSFEDYFNNKISAEDYDRFVKELPDFKVYYECYTGDTSFKKLDRFYAMLNDYYNVNITRNQYFIKNILGDRADNKYSLDTLTPAENVSKTIESLSSAKNVIVVVTGGFHTVGLQELLEKRGVSYLSITPNITKDSQQAETVYWQALREQNYFYNQAFERQLIISYKNFDPEFVGTITNALLDGKENIAKEAMANALPEIAPQLKEAGIEGMEVSSIKLSEDKKTLNYTLTTKEGKTYKFARDDKGTHSLVAAEKKGATPKRNNSDRIPSIGLAFALVAAIGAGINQYLSLSGNAIIQVASAVDPSTAYQGVSAFGNPVAMVVLSVALIALTVANIARISIGGATHPATIGSPLPAPLSFVLEQLAKSGIEIQAKDIRVSEQGVDILFPGTDSVLLSLTIDPVEERFTLRAHQTYYDKVDNRGPPETMPAEGVLILSGEINKAFFGNKGKLPREGVISDIHGGYIRYAALISEMLGIDVDENTSVSDIQNAIGKDKIDVLYILGDLLDRGSDGVRVIELTKKLTAAGAKYVTGNHDFWAFMNLMGFHLPSYEGFKGINNNYIGYGVGNVVALLKAKRSENAQGVNDKNYWAKKLAEYMAYADEQQNGEYKGLEDQFQKCYSAIYGYEFKDGKNVNKKVDAEFTGQPELGQWWGLVMGYLVGGVVSTGVRGVNKMSINWWVDRRKDLEKFRTDKNKEEWEAMARSMDSIIAQQKSKMDAELTKKNWEWAVLDAIMYRNYESAEWWSLDWVYHKGWGGVKEGLLSELNKNLGDAEKLTTSNYLNNIFMRELRDFYIKNFALYRTNEVRTLYMHGFLPLDKDGDVNIGRVNDQGKIDFTDENGESIKGFYYKGVQYQGPEIFKGFDGIAKDIRGFKPDRSDLADVYEAFVLVNSLYADLSTRIKPADLKRYQEFGFHRILNKLGVNSLMCGHNPVSKLKKSGIERDVIDKINGTRVHHTDDEMSNGYVKPDGKGCCYIITARDGIVNCQFPSGEAEAEHKAAVVMNGTEYIGYLIKGQILDAMPTTIGNIRVNNDKDQDAIVMSDPIKTGVAAVVNAVTNINGNTAASVAENTVDHAELDGLKGTDMYGGTHVAVYSENNNDVRDFMRTITMAGMNSIAIAPISNDPEMSMGGKTLLHSFPAAVENQMVKCNVYAEKVIVNGKSGVILYPNMQQVPLDNGAVVMSLISNIQTDRYFGRRLRFMGLPFAKLDVRAIELNGILTLSALKHRDLVPGAAVGFRPSIDQDDSTAKDFAALNADIILPYAADVPPVVKNNPDWIDAQYLKSKEVKSFVDIVLRMIKMYVPSWERIKKELKGVKIGKGGIIEMSVAQMEGSAVENEEDKVLYTRYLIDRLNKIGARTLYVTDVYVPGSLDFNAKVTERQWKEIIEYARSKNINVVTNVDLSEKNHLEHALHSNMLNEIVEFGFSGVALDFSNSEEFRSPKKYELEAIQDKIPEAFILAIPNNVPRFSDELKTDCSDIGITYVRPCMNQDGTDYDALVQDENMALSLKGLSFDNEESFFKLVDQFINSKARYVVLPVTLLSGIIDEHATEKSAGDMVYSRYAILNNLMMSFRERGLNPKNIVMRRQRAFQNGLILVDTIKSPATLNAITEQLMEAQKYIAGDETIVSHGLYIIPEIYHYFMSQGENGEKAFEEACGSDALFAKFNEIVNKATAFNGKDFDAAMDYVNVLHRKALSTNDLTEKKCCNEKLISFCEGLAQNLNSQKNPGTMDIENPSDKKIQATLGSARNALNAKVNGKAAMITNENNADLHAMEQLLSLRGSMLADEHYAQAKDILTGVYNSIQSQEVKSTIVKLYFAEALDQYSKKAHDQSYDVRKMMLDVVEPVVAGYDAKANYKYGVEVQFNNAARILSEDWHVKDMNNVIGITDQKVANAVGIFGPDAYEFDNGVNGTESDRNGPRLRVIAAMRERACGKNDMTIIDFMEVYPFMLASLSHTQEQLSAKDANSIFSFMKLMYNRKGISTGAITTPALLGVYADVIIARMRSEGKTNEEIRKAVRALIAPCLVAVAKEGGIAKVVSSYYPYKVMNYKNSVVAVAELTRLFNFGFDPKVILNQEDLKKAFTVSEEAILGAMGILRAA